MLCPNLYRSFFLVFPSSGVGIAPSQLAPKKGMPLTTPFVGCQLRFKMWFECYIQVFARAFWGFSLGLFIELN